MEPVGSVSVDHDRERKQWIRHPHMPHKYAPLRHRVEAQVVHQDHHAFGRAGDVDAERGGADAGGEARADGVVFGAQHER